ncbi:MAG: exodeoxyribonuclease VII small subunit [Aggregatilineales bacterium]
MDMISQLSFEEAYEELEEIVTKLESGNLPLEEAVELFERGRRLSDHCQKVLDEAELRVNKLTDDGELVDLE